MNKDLFVLRELAKQYREIAAKPVQQERKDAWRRQNSFKNKQPLVYVRSFAFNEIFSSRELQCQDPLYRHYEYFFQMMKFRDTIGDDFIIEPWLTVSSVYDPPVEERWGLPVSLGEKPQAGGAAAFLPVILHEDDIAKLAQPRHRINEQESALRLEKIASAVGDLLDVQLDRGPMLQFWTGDISTDLAKMRGLAQIMYDVYDRPEWFARLLEKMRDGILQVHADAEAAGDFSLLNHQNQAMPYAQELKDPAPHVFAVPRQELWWYMAAQEYTAFGPDQFHDFLLQYQLPILEKFGLVAYGCCEDLTDKIDHLRKIKHLRRIAVSPFADLASCAAQIGTDYILSWRPDPATMISYGLDEDFVRKTMRSSFAIFKEQGNYFDITLKDVETISGQAPNVAKWTRIVKEEIERAF